MESPETTVELTRWKKVSLYGAYLLLLLGIALWVTEFVLRENGARPWRVQDLDTRVEPGGKLFTEHPTLGYTHLPGTFTVTLGGSYSFQVTHLPNSLRITHPLASYEPSSKKEIWIFGCSYTHGWSLDDDNTYPWLLQERLPDHEVVNFGVNGYGTIHSLIQFREALEAKSPEVAVLAYAGFHDERNTFLRLRRKELVSWSSLGTLAQPYARLDEEDNLQYSFADVEYTEFPLMRHLALVHVLETKWNRIERNSSQSHRVSEALVLEMARLAREHDVKFVLASIQNGKRMLEFADENGIASVDLAVDLRVRENTNLPHDGHPSATAHEKYADGLEPFLRH